MPQKNPIVHHLCHCFHLAWWLPQGSRGPCDVGLSWRGGCSARSGWLLLVLWPSCRDSRLDLGFSTVAFVAGDYGEISFFLLSGFLALSLCSIAERFPSRCTEVTLWSSLSLCKPCHVVLWASESSGWSMDRRVLVFFCVVAKNVKPSLAANHLWTLRNPRMGRLKVCNIRTWLYGDTNPHRTALRRTWRSRLSE